MKFPRTGSILAAVVLLGGLTSCFNATSSAPSHPKFQTYGVKGAASPGRAAADLVTYPSTALVALKNASYIDAGPADYLTFTLKDIQLQIDGKYTSVWSGSQTITVSQSGLSDVSGITFQTLPVGKVTSIRLDFAPTGTMRGSLAAILYDGTANSGSGANLVTTVYTKSAKAYTFTGTTGSGGGKLEDFTTGSSEPVSVNFFARDQVQSVDFAVSPGYTLAAGDSPTFTLLVDLSRMLRFYDSRFWKWSQNQGNTAQGPNPSDMNDYSYFFAHSVFSGSLACFFGNPGAIEGYQTLFVTSDGHDVPGWATLIFNGAGNLTQGLLMGDSDNDLTIAKGQVEAATPVSGSFTLTYGPSGSGTDRVTDFVRAAAVGDRVKASFAAVTDTNLHGTAWFTLGFKP